MPNPEIPKTEIDRLLHIHKAIHGLVEQASTLLEPPGFAKSARAAAALAKEFEAELESNLLRAYDGSRPANGSPLR